LINSKVALANCVVLAIAKVHRDFGLKDLFVFAIATVVNHSIVRPHSACVTNL
jgi:hypothetical protein